MEDGDSSASVLYVANLPTKVIFDTNFLLVPTRFGIDIFSEAERVLETVIEFYVTDTILKEIKILKRKSKPSLIKDLEFAEKLAQQCTVIETCTVDHETVDDSILRTAKNDEFIVATTVSELRKKLREANVKVLYLRQGQFLALDGPLN